MQSPVVVIPDVLPPWTFRRLNDYVMAHTVQPSGLMLPGPDGVARHTLAPAYKRRSDVVIQDRDLTSDLALVLWSRLAGTYRAVHHQNFEHHRVGVYGPGGHFALHRDDMLPEVSRRRVAVVLPMCGPENYGGGELELPEAGLVLKPPANTLIAFPASALHAVRPVTHGVRAVYLNFLSEPA